MLEKQKRDREIEESKICEVTEEEAEEIKAKESSTSATTTVYIHLYYLLLP